MQSNQKEAPEFARRQMDEEKAWLRAITTMVVGNCQVGTSPIGQEEKKKTDVKVCGKSFLK